MWPISQILNQKSISLIDTFFFLVSSVPLLCDFVSWSSCALLAVSDSSGGRWSFCYHKRVIASLIEFSGTPLNKTTPLSLERPHCYVQKVAFLVQIYP